MFSAYVYMIVYPRRYASEKMRAKSFFLVDGVTLPVHNLSMNTTIIESFSQIEPIDRLELIDRTIENILIIENVIDSDPLKGLETWNVNGLSIPLSDAAIRRVLCSEATCPGVDALGHTVSAVTSVTAIGTPTSEYDDSAMFMDL
jgi:hypothetical protein